MGRIHISPFSAIRSKRLVLIFVLCIFFLSMIRNFVFIIVSQSLKSNEGERRRIVERNAMPFKCNQTYTVEAMAEFNTFDMFREVVATEKIPPNRYKIRKKNTSQITEIYVLPFTHVDPGWLQTFSDYSRDTNVILDNMVKFLENHPKMRFMWCEIAFLERWWSVQNDISKALVKRFISNGQLEIASGSWVMTDEATPYFPSTVDNIIEGQQFVYHELNVKPRVMWSNDPFGYGVTVPYLFTKTGIKWAVINRIHHNLKRFLQYYRAIPFRWRQYFDRCGENDMYTYILPYGHYDILNSCGPNQDICCQYDFKRINHYQCPGQLPVPTTDANVRERAFQLEKEFLKMSNLQETNVLLSMWGDDFRYDKLEEWYQQYDNLMPLFDFINTHSKWTRIRFGTFTDYFNALERNNKQENHFPPILSGDFFPYQCTVEDYWTGYYTTRPFYKRQERELHSLIRAADLLSTNAIIYLSSPEIHQTIDMKLTEARRNLALFQHHDAITGTSKNHVMEDYSKRMFASVKLVEDVLRIALNSLIHSNNFEIDNIPMVYNESSKKKLIVMDQPRTILIYNSAPNIRMEVIELLVSTSDVKVSGTDGPVEIQIEPYFDSVAGVFTENYLLVFFALLKPLSFTHYLIQKDRLAKTTITRILTTVRSPTIRNHILKRFHVENVDKNNFVLRTSQITTILNSENGLLDGLYLYKGNVTEWFKCKQLFGYYSGTYSGAYVMKLQNKPVKKLEMAGAESFIVAGPLRQIVYTLSQFIKQRISINNIPGAEGLRLHMQMHVDARKLSKAELITRFATNLLGHTTRFYTDSNGLQLIKRAEYISNDSPEMNYYPMPTALVLDDGSKRFSILSNVPHGVRTLHKTGFEIMLDRRLAVDDGKGLGFSDDGLPNDNLPVNMAFTFVLERMASTEEQQRRFAYNTLVAHQALQSLIYQPNIFIGRELLEQPPLQHILPFPCDVQLLTVRPLTSDPTRRLMILHRAGIDPSSLSNQTCSAFKLNEALKDYLDSIGAKTVQKTLLNGVENIGQEINYNDENFHLESMDFVAYLIR